MTSRWQQTVVNATSKHTASVIFFHGSGGSGVDIKNYVNSALGKKLSFPHIKLIFPSAPVQFYEAYQQHLPVWFQRKKLDYEDCEVKDSIDDACLKVDEIISNEVKEGISRNRIIIGGFSMGGGLSLLSGYYALLKVGGVFALSSFLSKDSITYKALMERRSQEDAESLPPLHQAHGEVDDLVPLSWGKGTCQMLKQFGVDVNLKTYRGLDHSLNRPCLEDLVGWLQRVLPEI